MSTDTSVSGIGIKGCWIISGIDKEVIGIIISTCMNIKE
jgi:hypothetical protein